MRKVGKRLCFCGEDADNAAVAVATLEVYHAIYESVEGVVLTDSHVLARMVLRTALTHDDVACNAGLTTPNLNA